MLPRGNIVLAGGITGHGHERINYLKSPARILDVIMKRESPVACHSTSASVPDGRFGRLPDYDGTKNGDSSTNG